MDSGSTEAKLAIIKAIASSVYSTMQYDYEEKGVAHVNAGRVIGLHETFEDKLAECRHHALYTQVLLQACGITSRLLKCDVDFGNGQLGAHAANIVRVNSKWYLLDATNPDSKDGVGEVFLIPLPERDIDPNSSNAMEWTVPRKKDGKSWKYRSRNNMYSMIRHE